MELKYILLFGLLHFSLTSLSQNAEISDEYSYSSERYEESLFLFSDGKFKWNVSAHFLKLASEGNWQLRGDSLILDSSPQKDRLIVWESRKNNSSQITFNVTNKAKDAINYAFCAITSNNDTIIINNQFKKTILKDKIKAFYIIDTKGLYSQTYFLKGEYANRFDILFETKRVFSNESWLIINGSVSPRGPDGAIQKYKLTKK